MNAYKKIFSIVIIVLTIVVNVVRSENALCQEAYGLSGSGGGSWDHTAKILIKEPSGFKRINEPVEVNLVLDKAKPQGEDIRLTDGNYNEIPCQVSVVSAHTYRVCFFAQADPNSVASYYLYFGNPNATKPNYGSIKTSLDNRSRSWQTDGVFIAWNDKAGFSPGTHGTYPITTLKFDNNTDKKPANDQDCLTDDYAWDQVYGYLGTNLDGGKPGDFGSAQAQIIETGPIFCELALGNARIRYFKGQNWIMTNQHVDSMMCFSKNYQFMKNGLDDEMFVPNWGSGDIRQWLTGYRSSISNPKYLALRNPNNRLVFGAIAKNVATWYMYAKYSGAWERVISFNDSSNRPDAKIYWYSDTSNGYEGIEKFSKQVLNPLEVEVVMDTEPPVTDISASPSVPDGQNEWYVTHPQVILTANEEGTIYYRLDSGDRHIYSSLVTIPEGEHKLSYYSVDSAGNTEGEKVADFKVDTAPPSMPLLLDPVDGFLCSNPAPTFYWNQSEDAGSGISHYSLYVDGERALANIDASASSAVSPELTDGFHNWVVRAYDMAGNFSDSKVSSITIDTVAPTTEVSVDLAVPNGNSGWYVSPLSIGFTPSETSTTYYRFGSDSYRPYESTVTAPEGIHDLSYYSTDLAGNQEQPKSLRIKTDYSQPEIAASIYPLRLDNRYLVNEPITFSYAATDSISGINSVMAAVDGELIPISGQATFAKVGEYAFNVSATDVAGNMASRVERFTVGYDIKWLPPVREYNDPSGKPHLVSQGVAFPIRFSALDGLGNFVADKSVKVVISDGANSATFAYGKGGSDIRINPCDGKYMLNITPKNYPWLRSGGDFTISVYFGGSNQYLGMLQDKVALELR